MALYWYILLHTPLDLSGHAAQLLHQCRAGLSTLVLYSLQVYIPLCTALVWSTQYASRLDEWGRDVSVIVYTSEEASSVVIDRPELKCLSLYQTKIEQKGLMMIVLVGQSKGGVGKSMIAANLAAMAAKNGQSVLLVDSDRQQTCNKWSSTRMLEGVVPDVRVMCMGIDANTSSREFATSIESLDNKFDVVIVDSGGQDSKELRSAMLVADVLIAPCRPTQSDIWGLDDLDQVAVGVTVARESAGNPLRTLVVLNQTDPLNIFQATEQALEAIQQMEFMKFSGCSIMMRPTFNAAFQSGRGVVDLDANKDSVAKAVADIDRLYRVIFEKEPVDA